MRSTALLVIALLAAGCAEPDAGSGPSGNADRLLVVDRGPAGAWDAAAVESPAVFRDPVSDRWGMVYTGYGETPTGLVAAVGLAWSDDLLTWTKDPASPIFGGSGVPGSPDAVGTTGPFVWLEGGTYYLLYIGLTEPGYERGRKTLNLAVADSIYGPWTRLGPIIEPAGDGWRREAIWHPSVVTVGGTYYCFFNATGVLDGLRTERIGYATAPAITGPWTVHDANAPLLDVGAKGAWDELLVGDPAVYPTADGWTMVYYGIEAGGHAYDGEATTTAAAFPLGWRKVGPPVLVPGYTQTFDAISAAKPFVVQAHDRLYHFYTAMDALTVRRIGLALR